MKTKFLLPLLLTLAAPSLHAHDATHEMAHAARNFLVALTPEQKAKATFDFKGEERTNWHFVPRARKGLAIKEMTQEQRLLAHALLSTGLSHRGYSEAVSIMSLEAVLAELEKGRTGAPVRDPELYYVTVFGAPGEKAPWGWRVEGHHLSLNFTTAGDAAPAMTPSFFGTNPGEIRQGARSGTRILANEEEVGRALVKSLTDEQRKTAVFSATPPNEIIHDPKRAELSKPEGIAQSQLTPEQSAQLVKLIREYLGRHRSDVAAEEWAEIEKAGLGNIYFAWAGGLERGQPHYYRIQGASFVFEYDNTQNEANHVHSIWR
ncbi:MAG: DUF3500 domain-containing protein, partial [Verrucomicrobiota bacterium]